MPTLQEILDKDLGLGSEQPLDKVASQNNIAESDAIEKLAQEVGLAVENSETTPASSETKGSLKKEARMSLDVLYTDMFPDDADIVKTAGASEKVAAQDKEAAVIEEAKGQYAFDKFAEFVDSHVTKMAEELAGGATISVGGGDAQPPHTMANNKPADAEKPIDTKPAVTNIVTPQKGGEVVGEEGAQSHGSGQDRSQLKTAALRKHLLLAGLNL